MAEALLLDPAIRTQRLLSELDTLLHGELRNTQLHRILLTLDPKIAYVLDPAKGIEESEQSHEHGWLISWYRGEPIRYEKHRKSARSFLRMLQAYTREPHRWDDDDKFLNPGTVRPIELWFGSPPEVI